MEPMTALRQLLEQVVAFVPNLFGALLILGIGYVITRVITTLLTRLLKLVGVDKLGERLQRIDVVASAGVAVSLSTVVAQIIYYFLMLVILVAATDVLGLEVVSNLVSDAIAYIPNLVAAIVILVIGAIVADILRGVAVVTCRSLGIPSASMIGSIVFWFVFVAILVTALSQAQLETDFVVINLSILLAGLALAFAIAYGLAARPLMAGFLAQFYNRGKLLVGDRVRLGATEGLIVSIDRASLTLEHAGQTVIVPLSKLQTETVVVTERGPLHDQELIARPREPR